MTSPDDLVQAGLVVERKLFAKLAPTPDLWASPDLVTEAFRACGIRDAWEHETLIFGVAYRVNFRLAELRQCKLPEED